LISLTPALFSSRYLAAADLNGEPLELHLISENLDSLITIFLSVKVKQGRFPSYPWSSFQDEGH